MRYRASLSPPVRDSWRAMFPQPRQRWVDDLALTGAELASIQVPVLLVHGRDDRVVPWRVSSGQLIDLLPDARLHVLSGCGHWTMIEKTAEFLAVVLPFLAPDHPAGLYGVPHRFGGEGAARWGGPLVVTGSGLSYFPAW
jgi:2-hydroxymuconate-semialdehyde hydrolase